MRHDVLVDDFAPGAFDLVHCRAALVHVADPKRAVPDATVARAAAALTDIDGSFARRLPQVLRDAGLERVRSKPALDFCAGGSDTAGFFCHVLEGAAASPLAGGHLSRGEIQEMRARFEDPERIDCGWPRSGA